MAAILGLDAKTYFAGTIASPVFTDEVGPIKEETVNLEKSLADITDRRANGWRLQAGTLKEGTVDIQMIYDPADADFNQFEDAFFSNDQLVLAFMDGDCTVAGTYYGLLGAFEVTSFSQPRPLEDAIVVDITLTPVLESSTNSPPEWHEVTVL